tara:strand:+ start:544 stop:867 length:324 start_codon:yes stop_codon:yes gene_type:complete
MTKVNINGVSRDMTAEEQAAYDAQQKAYTDGSEARKLEEIKKVRLEKLQATDWMASSDYTMPSYIKTWRQSLRDIPANHTDENAYDLLLARNSDGELTNSIWTQPTS